MDESKMAAMIVTSVPPGMDHLLPLMTDEFFNVSWLDRMNYTFGNNDTMTPTMIETVVSMMVPVFFGFIGLAGLLGNGLVVLVVAANQSMRSTTNLLIINLAAADLLFVVFCVPFTAVDYVLTQWPFGDYCCKFVQYMIVVTAHASAYTLALMSLDRFLAVVHPITSMSIRTERNASIAICFTWFIILTTAIPVAISHGVLSYPRQGGEYTACLFLHNKGYSMVAFHVSFFLSSYVVPLSLISFLYMGMLVRLWKGAPGGRASAESRRGKKRVTRMVVVVVLVFAFCWCPIQVILLLKSLKLYELTHASIIFQIVAHVLAYTNSCINPVLYAFLSDNFRKAFRKVSFFLSSYVVPLSLISFLYMGMLVRLWKGAPGGRASAESRRGKKRVTRMVVVVVLVFAFCWCPIQVILLLKSLKLYELTHASIIFQIVAHVLAYTNSCINPVLYAFLSDNFRKAFRKVSFFLSSYVVPLSLISFLYMGMLVRLWKGAPGGRASAESRRGKKRVTRMVVVVVLVFAFCWCPIQVILLLKSLKLYELTHASIIFQIVAHVLAYTNSCINPVLYAFLSDNFRKAFRKVVWCGRPPAPTIPPAAQTKTTRTTGNGTSNADAL